MPSPSAQALTVGAAPVRRRGGALGEYSTAVFGNGSAGQHCGVFAAWARYTARVYLTGARRQRNVPRYAPAPYAAQLALDTAGAAPHARPYTASGELILLPQNHGKL
jgi:hypothetical protein